MIELTHNQMSGIIVGIFLLFFAIIITITTLFANPHIFENPKLVDLPKIESIKIPSIRMRVYNEEKGQNYDDTIPLAISLSHGVFNNPVTFVAYWKGSSLNDKHLAAIQSCYVTNVQNYNHRRIILWLHDNVPNDVNEKIKQFAEIRIYNETDVFKNTPFETRSFINDDRPAFYSDSVRYALLYTYGGIWLDLDMFFLRSLDPILIHFGDNICVYAWSNEKYPNGAFMMSLKPLDSRFADIINFFITRNRGIGFQISGVTYFDPLDFLVLPCAWFDPSWVTHPLTVPDCDMFFSASSDKTTLSNFCYGAFAYHWHNRWDVIPDESSPFSCLLREITQLTNQQNHLVF
jgi:glycosyl transferase-like sugar-binding protein